MLSRRLCALALIACAAVALLSGCTQAGPVWVDEDTAYTATTIKGVFDHVDTSGLAGRSSKEAEDLRHDALVALRKRGGAAAEAADLVTKTFPSTAGVPLYVEKASFENRPDALVMVEIIGPADGELSLARLWVLSDTGDVLFSSAE